MTERNQYLLHAVGWISASIAFNIANTVVYGTLYPKLLQSISADFFDNVFSIVNSLTTFASSFLLPSLGVAFDKRVAIKSTMVISGLTACMLSALLPFAEQGMAPFAALLLTSVVYVLAMFFLRTLVMNDNALLFFFPEASRVTLSLVNNFVGFGLSLGNLILFNSDTFSDDSIGSLIVYATLLCFLFTLLSVCAPSDLDHREPGQESFLQALKGSVAELLRTAKLVSVEPDLKQVATFLVAYLLFSASGTIYTIYLVILYSVEFDYTLTQTFNLQIMYYIAMVSGVVVGIGMDAIMKSKAKMNRLHVDIVTQQVVNVLIGFVLVINLYSFAAKRETLSRALSACMGFLYSYQASVARGILAKIMRGDLKCQLSGLYSSATYISISICSVVYAVLASSSVDTGVALLGVLLVCLGPSYYILPHCLPRKYVNTGEGVQMVDEDEADLEEGNAPTEYGSQ
ncbi:hypothetical protein KIPB_002502 [Kipferlia bialata]|uniref:Uncharacterized protein n=1 Tax=Kipferlia bialata TaxID=797122 RepID=A0A9K3CRU7_9EUKA|nr:hypothetical protein KIPB_002502 [Kipferlia bialata]|eukprot:g2502.t1